MKVLMITPDSQMIDRRILLEAKSLVDNGFSVILLAGFECKIEESYLVDGIQIYRYVYDWDDEYLKKIRAKLPKIDKLQNIVNKVYMTLARTIFKITPYERYIFTKAMQFDFDILHIHDFPILKVGSFIAQAKKVTFIYDAHELYYAQDVLPVETQKKYRKIEKIYIKKVDTVITVNRFIADIMAKDYNIETPKVIWNATSFPKDFKLDKNKLREKCKLGNDEKIILYQGWISPERNIESIVKAVKYLDTGISLAVIGYGEYENVLKAMMKKEGTENRIFFLGEVASDDMLSFTVGADLGLIPYLPIDLNHKYCSPNKFFEYMLAKVPVVTHKLAFFEDMEKLYRTVKICNMGDPKNIADTINNFFSESVQNKEILGALEIASLELGWNKEQRKLLDIYSALDKTSPV